MRIDERPLQDYPWLARLIFWFQKRKYGEALVPSKLWARVPRLMYGLQFFYRTLDSKTTQIEPSVRSLVSVRISQINHCSFCSDIGQSFLDKQGVSFEKISQLDNYKSSELFNEKERAALNYADAVTITHLGVTEILFTELRKHFSDDQIVELTAIIAFQNMSSKFNSALDVPTQGFCLRK